MTEALPVARRRLDPVGAVPLGRERIGRLTNLQVLRALAAAFVVLLHAGLQLETSRGDGRLVAIFNVHLGALGVALFFAMSGFLMAQLVRSIDSRTFLLHRVVRIYPIFLIVALLYILLGPRLGLDVTRDWLALTLAPVGPRSYPLGIEWTLVYETTFYVGLFLISAAGLARHLDVVAAGWLTLIAAAGLAGHEAAAATHFPRLHHILFSDVNVAFAAGLLVPQTIRRGWAPPSLCLLAVPASCLLVWAEVTQFRWWLSLSAVLMVAGAVQIRQVSVKGLLGRAAVRLGDWSYALYLVRIPAIFAVFKLAPASASSLSLFAGAIGSSVAAAALFGSLDMRLYRSLRRRTDGLAPRQVAAAAWLFTLAYLGIAGTMAVQVERQEAAIARVAALLSRLPPGSLADAEHLAAGIEQAGLRASSDLAASLDRVERLPGGNVMAVGWAVDLARPGNATFMALACAGRFVTITQPQRFRPDVAAARGRPDLQQHRIGFTAVVDQGSCPPGSSLLSVFADSGGRLIPGRAVEGAAAGTP